MTTGERLKLRRKEIDMSAEKLAELIGVSAATIYRYENGAIEKVPGNLLEPIAAALRIRPQYLMGWEDSAKYPANLQPMFSTRKVPRLGTIACGAPILAEENISAYDDIPGYVKADCTLVCKGDSMINARIFDGDVVCIREQSEVESGDIAAVLIDDEATLKRFRKYDDRIVLEAENPTFPDLKYTGADMAKVHIIGKATHFISAVR